MRIAAVVSACVVALASLALSGSGAVSGDGSITAAGTGAGNGSSTAVAIGDDGRLVAFLSSASNLVAGDRNKRADLFVYDRASGKVQRSEIGHRPATYDSALVAISRDLRFLAFLSDRRGVSAGTSCSDTFVYDRSTRKTEQVDLNRKGEPATPGKKGNCSWGLVLSADGRFVAFNSASPDLVAGGAPAAHTQCPDDFLGCSGWDVFVRDRATSTTERVSVSSSGRQANGDSRVEGISVDGRLVYFSSDATNLTGDARGGGVFVHDRLTKTTRRVPIPLGPVTFSLEARFAAFSIGGTDLYVYERATGRRALVRVTKSGKRASARVTPVSISTDGRYVVFLSAAGNLAAPSAHARCDNEYHVGRGTPPGNGYCADLYVTDRKIGKTELVTAGRDGKPANDNDFDDQPAFVSRGGRFVAFTATVTNLVAARDTNQSADVFLRDVKMHTTTLISAAR